MSSATADPKHKRVVVKCTHHWDLGGPRGGIVHAVCRKCGAEQDYPSNHINKFVMAPHKKEVASPLTTPKSKALD